VVWCGLLVGCGKPAASPEDQGVLVKAGGTAILVRDFQLALDAVRAAYDPALLREPLVAREIKSRLLDQLTQEALIRERGRVLGITVGEDERDRAEAHIRADYPGESFEQMLLQQAVSYPVWCEQLRMRLLADKVIDAELGSRLAVEPREIVAAADKLPPAEKEQLRGGHAEPLRQRLLRRLRRQKLESAYPEWIERLRQEIRVTVDTRLRDRLLTP
jgi:hypothetical protein